MRIVLIGAPGSGKGTHSALLAEHRDVPRVSAGELLRDLAAADTPMDNTIARYLDLGDLVPDDLMVAAMRDALAEAAPSGDYILEGFPRTVGQARHAESLVAPDAVIHLDVPDDVARARLTRRAASGRTDDAEQAVIERRLRHFHKEIEPILQHYRDRGILTTIDANQPPDAVHAAILRALAHREEETGHDDAANV
jgi:adenylate kinase